MGTFFVGACGYVSYVRFHGFIFMNFHTVSSPSATAVMIPDTRKNALIGFGGGGSVTVVILGTVTDGIGDGVGQLL